MPLAPQTIICSPARLADLERTGLLDSAADAAFDRLTRIVRRVLKVPVALVSLVDSDRQFFKSADGLSEPYASTRQTPLSYSFCQWVVANAAPLIVRDARHDPLVSDSKAVSELGILAYLGIPLCSPEGHILGSLAAIDRQPRDWSSEEIEALTDFAALAETEIRLRITAIEATEHAQAADEARVLLADSERRYRGVVECLGEGLIITDPEGIIQFVNDQMTDLTGYEKETLMGQQSFRLLLPPSEWEASQARNHRCAEGKSERYTAPLLHQDGRRTWFEVYVTPFLGPEGSIVGTLSAYTDVTARREAEERLRTTTEELRRSNETLQEFASVASHDLQEPLRKIQAFGDRLHSKAEGSLSPEAKDYLERMLGAAGRMQTLIYDLLLYSRVASKVQPFSTVDLNTVVAGVVSDFEARLALDKDFSALPEVTNSAVGVVAVGNLPILEADSAQMRQLFQNLIGNALKFRRAGHSSQVSVEARLIGRDGISTTTEFSGSESENKGVSCQVLIRDNGIGFDPRYAERIFDVFERLNVRGEYEGNGMGLAICRRIVERHGGQIVADSTPGEGTTVTVTLPLHH